MTDTRAPLRALVCPRCHQLTTERTSTGNGFCRACDYIFANDAPVTFTQDELHSLRDAGAAHAEQAEQQLAAERQARAEEQQAGFWGRAAAREVEKRKKLEAELSTLRAAKGST